MPYISIKQTKIFLSITIKKFVYILKEWREETIQANMLTKSTLALISCQQNLPNGKIKYNVACLINKPPYKKFGYRFM
jgi:hypothetical protein